VALQIEQGDAAFSSKPFGPSIVESMPCRKAFPLQFRGLNFQKFVHFLTSTYFAFPVRTPTFPSDIPRVSLS